MNIIIPDNIDTVCYHTPFYHTLELNLKGSYNDMSDEKIGWICSFDKLIKIPFRGL